MNVNSVAGGEEEVNITVSKNENYNRDVIVQKVESDGEDASGISPVETQGILVIKHVTIYFLTYMTSKLHIT